MFGVRKCQAAAILAAAAVLLMLVAAGCGTPRPVIKSVKPNKGLINTGIEVTGTFFGATQGKSTLTVGGRKGIVMTWSDTSISATVPAVLKAGTYPVVVTTAGGPSNRASYTVFATFTGSTPLPAMIEFLKNRKIETKGMTYAVVQTSDKDPNWKIDKAVSTGGDTYYFLFHKTPDGWTIIDFGTSLTAEQMKIDGAPGDLLPQG